MRILVMSDSHGDYFTLEKIVKAQALADVIIYLGDGEKDFEKIRKLPAVLDKKLVAVAGNCDVLSTLPKEQIVEVAGKKILATHGHIYNVKLTYSDILKSANEKNVDIILFGHTHKAINEYVDGKYMLNPGSLRGYGGSYAFIDILDNGSVVTQIVPL